jgi:hypothetical protein
MIPFLYGSDETERITSNQFVRYSLIRIHNFLSPLRLRIVLPCVLIFLTLLFVPLRLVWAYPLRSRGSWQTQPTPGELINAVNSLRQAHGLQRLISHPILMQTAQSQANALLASQGAVGHTRPGGMSYTQQLLTLGYPLAGDLSLGGFRAENFIFGNDLTPEGAVELWLGDEPHTSTMLSPNYVHIGAGVAIGSDGTTYYVIDCARPTTSGLPQDEARIMLTKTVSAPADALSQYIVPVARSTARPDGDVIHQVQYGQSLWSIAIQYGTTINGIRTLNNLSDTTVYEGQVLLILKGATQPPSATETPLKISPLTSEAVTPTSSVSASTPTVTSQPAGQTNAADDDGSATSPGLLLAILLILVVVGSVTAIWFIREPNETQARARKH